METATLRSFTCTSRFVHKMCATDASVHERVHNIISEYCGVASGSSVCWYCMDES